MFKLDVDRVRALLFKSGLSMKAFAEQAKLNNVTARKLVRDNATATAKTIAALARFFGVDGNSLIRKS